MKFVLTCGGTAGHINPALAVAQRLRELEPDCEILFLGAEGMMEMELVPREGFEIRPLKVTNLSRGHHLRDLKHNVRTGLNLLDADREAKRILKEFRPDAVLGTGGYVCYPVLHEAHRLAIPTLLHESNAVPGLTTRMLEKEVDCLLLGMEESLNCYPAARDLRYTGTPVRAGFSAVGIKEAKARLGLDPEQPLVVSMWGSLGSGHMNETVLKMLPLMKGQQDFRLIHATGRSYYRSLIERLREKDLRPEDCGAEIRDYIFDTETVISAADLVLCRAGASTLSELTRIGKPALIVPSPNVTNHHQERNARVLERVGAARVLLEGEFDEKSFLQEIRAILRDREALRTMADRSRALAVADAPERITEAVLFYARGRGGREPEKGEQHGGQKPEKKTES